MCFGGRLRMRGSLGERSIKDSIIAELALQAERQLKDSAFAFDQLAL